MVNNNNIDIIISAKDSATKAVSSLTKTVGKLGIALGAVSVALATAVGAKAVKEAAAFEARMSNVATLVNTTRINMDKLSTQVLEISKQVPVTNSILSEGLYQTISSGITDTDDAMNVLNQSAKLGVAGLADTSQAVDLMTSAINAFGLDAKDAERVSDTLFTTVKLGKTTVAELAGSFGNAAPIASAAGVSFEELQSAAAALTTAGQDTATAYTNLKGVFTAIVKPSDDAQKAAEELGIEFNVAALESKGLVGFLQDIEKATDGDIEVMARLFPNVRALSAALALTGAQSDLMANNMDEMTKAGGATEEAFKKQNETFNAQYQLLKNNLSVILINIGNIILPHLTKAIKIANDFFNENQETINTLISEGYDKLKNSMKIIIEFFDKTKRKIGELINKYSELMDILKVVFTPFIVIAFRVMGGIEGIKEKIISLKEKTIELSGRYTILRGVIEKIIDKFKESKDKIVELISQHKSFGDFLKSFFSPKLLKVKEMMDKYGISIFDVISALGLLINPIGAIIFWLSTKLVQALDDKSIEAITRFIAKIKEWIALISTKFTKWIEIAINKFEDFYSKVKESEAFITFIDWIAEASKVVVDFATTLWQEPIKAIKGMIETVLLFKNKLIEAFIGTSEDAKNKSIEIWTKIKENINNVISYLKDDLFPKFMEKIEQMKQFITDLFEKNKVPLDNLKESFGKLTEKLTPLFDALSEITGVAFGDLGLTMNNFIEIIFPAIIEIIDHVVKAFGFFSDVIIDNKDFFITFVRVVRTELDILVKAFDIAFKLILHPIDTFRDAMEWLTTSPQTINSSMKKTFKNMFGFADGGIVPQYFAGGGQTRGTDTVPAMLTPGELILNKSQQKNLVSGMGGVTINIQGNFVGSRDEAERFGDIIVRKLGLSTAIA